MTREDILNKAKECVCGQREQDYGTPEHNFQLIADLWTDYLGRLISTTDVAMMMALLKIARIKNGGGTGDSFVDLAGYAACGGELNSIYKGKENSDLKKTLDDAWNEGTGLFSKAYNEDDKNKRYCDNCRWKDEKSDGKHCDTCCHNDTSSKESHWVKVYKECDNCLHKDKSPEERPCNKCILNGGDEFRWVSDAEMRNE